MNLTRSSAKEQKLSDRQIHPGAGGHGDCSEKCERGFRRHDPTEEETSDTRDRTPEIIQPGTERGKNETERREPTGARSTSQGGGVHVTGAPDRAREAGAETLFGEIMADDLSGLGTEVNVTKNKSHQAD